MLGIPPLAQGPGNIETFATVYEVIRKLAHILSVGHFFGAQEDLGMSFILNAFTDDAVAVARTAIEDTPPSIPATYRFTRRFARSCLITLFPVQLKIGGTCEHLLFGRTLSLAAGRRLFVCTICSVQFLC